MAASFLLFLFDGKRYIKTDNELNSRRGAKQEMSAEYADHMVEESTSIRSSDRVGRSGRISFRTKFLLGIGVILLFFCSICALLLYQQGKLVLEEAAYAKSQIVMASVEANQSYVRDVLRPKMYELLGEDAFVLEAMSTSYVSRVVLDEFNRTLPEYRYRRVAVDARSPASEANPLEVEKIRYFESNPDKQGWRGIIRMGDEPLFMSYRPVYFHASCLHCHGDPKEAPGALLDRYGSTRGFWRKNGEIAGIMAVGIPVNIALAQVREKALTVFIGGFFFTAVLFLAIGFFFNRLVVHDLRGLLNVFRTGLRKDEEKRFFDEIDTKDEIGALKSAAGAMALYLRDSRRQLERNAEDLERTVDERTRELSESERRLRDQVAARSRELKSLNTIAELTTKANCLSDVFPKVLEQTLGLFSARGAGLYLFQQDFSALELICHRNAPGLIDRVESDSPPCGVNTAASEILEGLSASLCEAACGHISFFVDEEVQNGLNIPLCCRGRILGVITAVGVNFEEVTPESMELLFSVGRQTGIAIESLQTMRKLLQSKDLLQSVFDGITDMVILMDKDFRIKMVNKAYIKRYSIAEEDVLGRPCHELHSDDVCSYPDCGMLKTCNIKAPVVEEVVSSGGEIFLMHFYPVLDEQGEVESVVRYARDITQQKLVEQQIQQTEKLASLGQLAAGIAHEINNPLGVILCYADLLKRQLEVLPQSLSDVSTIEKHALNCKHIVSDLLKFARSESTARQLVSLNRTIEDVANMISHQFNKNGIEIQLDLDSNLPLLNMDPGKMKQVFLNLFMNAQQAIGRNGVIRVGASYLEATRQAQIIFRDSGKGIPPQILQKVFDPFFTTKAPGEGTGLGLSVSYGIIKDHRGDIHVASEPGEWTQFSILLPVSEEL
jgi:PAS domain S-box-containing protein